MLVCSLDSSIANWNSSKSRSSASEHMKSMRHLCFVHLRQNDEIVFSVQDGMMHLVWQKINHHVMDINSAGTD